MAKPLVLVTWADAQDHPQKWVDEEDAAEFGNSSCLIVSVGFLVSKTDKYITLAGDWDETDKDYGRVTKIPCSMMVELKEICHPSPTPSD